MIKYNIPIRMPEKLKNVNLFFPAYNEDIFGFS